jgi:hypothetical protein
LPLWNRENWSIHRQPYNLGKDEVQPASKYSTDGGTPTETESRNGADRTTLLPHLFGGKGLLKGQPSKAEDTLRRFHILCQHCFDENPHGSDMYSVILQPVVVTTAVHFF